MATKKKVLGVDPLSWIKKTEENDYPERENTRTENKKFNTNKEVPKYETYEVKLTVRLSEKHLNYLSILEREIMKKRSKENRKERITKNSIIRAMIDAFKNLSIEKTEIATEEELKSRFEKSLKRF